MPILTNAATQEGEEEACVAREVGWDFREEFEASDGCKRSQSICGNALDGH